MNLTHQTKITKRSKKRVGRGAGSGKGWHTVGRGQKGQKSRNTVNQYNFGGAMGASMIKRLPLLRGKGKLKPLKYPQFGIAVGLLNTLPSDSIVTVEVLVTEGIITKSDARRSSIKILGNGNLTIPLTVEISVTTGARKKISDAGGTVRNETLLEIE